VPKALGGLALAAPTLAVLGLPSTGRAQSTVTVVRQTGPGSTNGFVNLISGAIAASGNARVTPILPAGSSLSIFASAKLFGPASVTLASTSRRLRIGTYAIYLSSSHRSSPFNVSTSGGGQASGIFRTTLDGDLASYNITATAKILNFTFTAPGTPSSGSNADGSTTVVPARTNQGSPAVVIVPAPEPDPDPITIIDVGAQLSAKTTGEAVINTVNGGSRAHFRGFSKNVSSHLNGLTGFGAPGNDNAYHRANLQLNSRIAGAARRWERAARMTAGVISEPISVETFVPKWELYTMGAFNRQDQDRIGQDPGYTSDAWTGTIGIERRLGRRFLIGFATTLGRNTVESGGNSGSADLDAIVLDGYALYSRKHFWTSLRYGYGMMDIDVTRNAFPGVTPRAATDSANSVISWGAGLNLPLNLFGMEFLHGPNLGLDYTTGSIDGYTERGGGAFNLIVNEHAYASLLSDVGWSIAKQHHLGKLGRGFLQLRAGWNHEHLLDESNTEYQFETSPITTFDPATGSVTEGPAVFGAGHNPTPQNDYMSLGLHLMQLLGEQERWILQSGYQTQLFRSDFTEHYGYLRLGLQF
tara:strand:+ start:648 stop:2402 length:1755 start_codon:yes stop_codon:yes gene_type:complete